MCNSSNFYIIGAHPALNYARNPLHTFPHSFSVGGNLPTCCGLVSDTANKSTTSWQQVVVMEFGKRHDTTDFRPRQLVTDLLWTCYGETGVMDFGFYACAQLKIPTPHIASSVLTY